MLFKMSYLLSDTLVCASQLLPRPAPKQPCFNFPNLQEKAKYDNLASGAHRLVKQRVFSCLPAVVSSSISPTWHHSPAL